MQVAQGKFTVAMEPHHDGVFDAGRMSLNKNYSGDLVATGKGQMLSHRSAVRGSAGYVAIELVTGILDGKQGSFVLQHHGVMQGETQSLSISIVPDSGTEALASIAGSMEITISEGEHFYTLNYALK
ncbi:DUF3224 domain-containing protein [Alteromonas oceanisediminis]|uniref:DUF3224 domain-containing protein n=1 Tax=Alteromonas oceanisediminis TaxID=2836180 RepID=UPI001BD924CD|nr:DUF3224 domain-containing protein [Alteromonas oceanisediminis]MBT0586274.1 DUF3224 domain-containing protein [Alteromonas oceanisediminis]